MQDAIAIAVAVAAGAWLVRTFWRQLFAPSCGMTQKPGGADGFALARAVRVVRPGLPVVYASGRHGTLEPGQAVAGGRFLAKPFSPSLAGAVLRELMAQPGPCACPPPLPEPPRGDEAPLIG